MKVTVIEEDEASVTMSEQEEDMHDYYNQPETLLDDIPESTESVPVVVGVQLLDGIPVVVGCTPAGEGTGSILEGAGGTPDMEGAVGTPAVEAGSTPDMEDAVGTPAVEGAGGTPDMDGAVDTPAVGETSDIGELPIDLKQLAEFFSQGRGGKSEKMGQGDS